MPFRRSIQVANPSSYFRSDFVECDLGYLSVPPGLGEGSLRLSRINSWGKEEIPYQIDEPCGSGGGYRVMTFFSANTPPGSDDYTQPSAEFLLEEARPSLQSVSPRPDRRRRARARIEIARIRRARLQRRCDQTRLRIGNETRGGSTGRAASS